MLAPPSQAHFIYRNSYPIDMNTVQVQAQVQTQAQPQAHRKTSSGQKSVQHELENKIIPNKPSLNSNLTPAQKYNIVGTAKRRWLRKKINPISLLF